MFVASAPEEPEIPRVPVQDTRLALKVVGFRFESKSYLTIASTKYA